MRVIVILIAITVGIMSGLGVTWLTSTSRTDFGAVKIGAWITWPKSGTVEADPYSRSIFARAGELPLGFADGISFTAVSDDDGANLDGRCDIHIGGLLPAARFWTLTIYDLRGRLIGGRSGFTSTEILWKPDAHVDIVLAPRARSGNWIPTGDRDRVIVILRLYDAPVGIGGRSIDKLEMPSIRQESCP